MSSFHWKLLKEKILSPTETIKKTVFTIIMVNDVYEMLPDNDGLGGLAELQTIIEQEKFRSRHCISTLNGDFMSASTLATKYKGYHMIDILNHIDLDYVTLGNHEFDFGTPNVLEKIKESRFKWICSNVVCPDDHSKVLPGLIPKVIHEVDGFRVGIFGVCTKNTEYLSRPGTEAVFLPSIIVANKMVKELREEDKCDVVVAITHLTIGDDRELARNCPGIDCILGGHDHSPHTQCQGSCFIHKAGHDAQYVTRIDLFIEKKQTPINGENFVQLKVFPSCNMIVNRGYKPNQKVSEIIDKYMKQLPEGIMDEIGLTITKMDSSTESVRSKETTFANFIADVFLDSFGSDLAIINGGGIRGDRFYDSNKRISRLDMLKEFPFPNTISLAEIKGSDLLEVTEQGVAKAECVVGSFPHFSRGVCVQYDTTKAPMKRLYKMTLNNEEIDPNRVYSIATVTYILNGGDGFSTFTKAKVKEHPLNGKSVYDLVVDWIENNRKVGAKKEGRIYDISKKNATATYSF